MYRRNRSGLLEPVDDWQYRAIVERRERERELGSLREELAFIKNLVLGGKNLG